MSDVHNADDLVPLVNTSAKVESLFYCVELIVST